VEDQAQEHWQLLADAARRVADIIQDPIGKRAMMESLASDWRAKSEAVQVSA
jgi:hypothetical protein